MLAGAEPEAGVRLHTAVGSQRGKIMGPQLGRERLQFLEPKIQILKQRDPVAGYLLLYLIVQCFICLDHAQQGTVCGADKIQMDFHGDAPPARSFDGGGLGSGWIMLSASFFRFSENKNTVQVLIPTRYTEKRGQQQRSMGMR